MWQNLAGATSAVIAGVALYLIVSAPQRARRQRLRQHLAEWEAKYGEPWQPGPP